MIKRIKLAFLFLIACGLLAVFCRSTPRANAGGNSDPVAIALGTDKNPPAKAGGSDSQSRATHTDPPATAGGTDSNPGAAAGFTDSDFAAHVEQLKKKLPSDDFTIAVQKPFVVIGDEPADDVKEHSIRTVKWAVDKLKQEYFSKDERDSGYLAVQRRGVLREECETAVRV